MSDELKTIIEYKGMKDLIGKEIRINPNCKKISLKDNAIKSLTSQEIERILNEKNKEKIQ